MAEMFGEKGRVISIDTQGDKIKRWHVIIKHYA
jgi:hypothetical protein